MPGHNCRSPHDEKFRSSPLRLSGNGEGLCPSQDTVQPHVERSPVIAAVSIEGPRNGAVMDPWDAQRGMEAARVQEWW
jgi:hypothetical protein